jgi:hypothetical protein
MGVGSWVGDNIDGMWVMDHLRCFGVSLDGGSSAKREVQKVV